MEHLAAVGLIKNVPEVARPHGALGRDFIVGAREEAHRGVARAVGEEPAAKPGAAGGADVLGRDRDDLSVAGLHLVDPLLEHERDSRLGAGHP